MLHYRQRVNYFELTINFKYDFFLIAIYKSSRNRKYVQLNHLITIYTKTAEQAIDLIYWRFSFIFNFKKSYKRRYYWYCIVELEIGWYHRKSFEMKGTIFSTLLFISFAICSGQQSGNQNLITESLLPFSQFFKFSFTINITISEARK